MGDTNHFQKQTKKKSFWFDPNKIEHAHITFEHVQTHK